MARYSSSVIQPQPQSIQPMKLSELLGYIKGVISNAFSGTYWITAEVSNISQSPHNGHVYFDLVETQGGVKMAFVRGNLWASRASQVLASFLPSDGWVYHHRHGANDVGKGRDASPIWIVSHYIRH